MTTLKLWLDDRRPAPEGWTHAHSVNEAIRLIDECDGWEMASLDNDLGEYDADGGEGFKLVDWMEATDRWPQDRPTVHSSNPVRAEYMRKVITASFPRNRC